MVYVAMQINQILHDVCVCVRARACVRACVRVRESVSTIREHTHTHGRHQRQL